MINSNEYIYLKFPCVLKKKLEEKAFNFPEEIKFEYEPIFAYRCIEREKNDNSQIDKNDFLSNVEELIYKKKKIKKKRGQINEPRNDIKYYATSLSMTRENLENTMHLPRPSKKICSGYVYMEGGPQLTEEEHINWWVFADVDLSGFTIEKGDKNE